VAYQIERLRLPVIPFDAADAKIVASLWPPTRPSGLSLGDRACLALGLRLGVPVLTADRAWASLKLGVDVGVIR
jgi:PIN domain nuclease of toxin-antitoxin system